MRSAKRLEDIAALLIIGIAYSFFSWLFWSQLGEHAFAIFSAGVIVVLAVENRALSASLRAAQSSGKQ